jgi:hypothetical protein
MINKHESRAWRLKIREILNHDWDPIGGCPADEYEGYVGKLAGMIRSGASDEEILVYLRWAEVEHMGFGRFDLERGKRVVKTLRALGPAP